MGAGPDGVELFHDFSDEGWIIGDNAGLEVSSVLALGAHSGAGQIGAAGVGETSVNDYGFKMNSRAKNSLHAGY